MRLFLMCVPFWLWGLAYGATLSSQDTEQPQAPAVVAPIGEPEFIVIFDLPKDDQRDGHPLLNMRFVVHAENEYEAVIRAVLYMRDITPEWVAKRAKFVEVAVKKPDSKR